MPNIINITDKLINEKPCIIVGDKRYEVNNGLRTVMRFEELATESNVKSMVEALKVALGANAVEELNVDDMSQPNFKVLLTALMAAIQGVTYEEAEVRFRQKEDS